MSHYDRTVLPAFPKGEGMSEPTNPPTDAELIVALVAALRSSDFELQTLYPRLTPAYQKNIAAARDANRDAFALAKAAGKL